MRRPIDRLPAKVPGVERDGSVILSGAKDLRRIVRFFAPLRMTAIRHRNLDRLDLDAVRRVAILDPLIAPHRRQQAALPDFPLADQNQLRLVEDNGCLGRRLQIRLDRVESLLVCGGKFGIEGVAFEAEVGEIKLSNRTWQIRNAILCQAKARQFR